MNRKQIGIAAALAGIALVAGGVWYVRDAGQGDAPAGRKVAVAPAPVPGPDAAPSFDVVRVEPDGTAVIAGRAAPGATVTVLDGGKPVGTATADSRGEWVLQPAGPLAPGARELTVEAARPDGAKVTAPDAVVLVVPEAKRDVAGRRQAETGEALALLAPRNGAARALQVPAGARPPEGAAPLPPGEIVLDTVDYDSEGRLGVGGRARPGSEVHFYIDTVLAGRAVADAGGRWALTPDRLLEPGRYVLRADQLDGKGGVAARAEVTLDRRPLSEDLLGGKAVVVLPGNNLWNIARRAYGEGLRYTTIFEANQEQIRDPNLVYPGQIFVMPPEPPKKG
ncbi:MAG TPA: Ig-like domain-containing protein [Azospirillaceae bacterium]|nr:Ig-like domain-containing protein [Azospirillaceae bacterium]